MTEEPFDIDTSTPQAARRYDYLLGGKDNFAADRTSAEELKKALPTIHLAAQENRRFLQRAVHHLATHHHITQFLDIGVGMPTTPNVHEIAQTIHPTTRVLYIDHDPVVAVHARALLTGTQPGLRTFLTGDLRKPEAILDNPLLHTTLNLDQPIGLLLIAVLHFIDDDELAYTAVRRLYRDLPHGSIVVISHATFDPLPTDVADRLRTLSKPTAGHGPFRARTRTEVQHFTDGLTLHDPGVVSIVDWMPDHEPAPQASIVEATMYGAVAEIP